MLTKYWFANANKEMCEKRSKEEAHLFLNEWGTAKQRIEEELVSKQERAYLASDPTRLAVMHDPNMKVLTHKIYRNQGEFLDSDESSLNTSHNSDEVAPIKKEETKKMITKRISSQAVVEEDEAENDRQSDRSREERSFDSDKPIKRLPTKKDT